MPRKIHLGWIVLLVALVACVAAQPLTPTTITVDPTLTPATPSLPPIDGETEPRPVATLTDGTGAQSDFVANELLLFSDDQTAVDAFVARWGGELLATVDPADHGIADVGTMHLIRIDPALADNASLVTDLMAIDPDSRSDLNVSSDAAVGLLAAAASEGADGMEVAVNWVSQNAVFEDDSTTEAPTGPNGYSSDAFDWSYMRRGGAMDINVTGAWQMLEIDGKLGNRVEIAILDGGFVPNDDWPAGWEAHSVVGGNALNREGVGSSVWHGTDVAAAAGSLADNGFGAAGAAGPVADLLLVYTTYDFFFSIAAVLEAAGRGADIINMSYRSEVPATVSWTVLPFEATTAAVRAAGVLIFGSAGNDGINVDEEDCFIVCWEETWHTPCENVGVICVGGVRDGSKSRDPGSNYGPEAVDIWAPFSTYVKRDVPNPGVNDARFAAGVAALIWAADPSLSANQVEAILFSTATSSPDSRVNRIVNAFRGVRDVLGDLDPSITITSPSNGATVDYGGLNIIDFSASTDDFEDGEDCCTVSWSSNLDGALGNGLDIQYAFSGAAVHQITATVTDSGGNSSSDTITLNVTGTPPAVTILDPSPGETFTKGIPEVLAATVIDVNEPLSNLCANAVWTSTVGTDNVPDGTCTPQVTFLTTGARTLTLTVADSDGNEGSDSVNITIIDPPPSGPPTAIILEPQENELFDNMASILIEGAAFDPDGGAMTYEWVVNDQFGSDHVIGTTLTFNWTPFGTVPANCGSATVQLTLTATDEDLDTGSDTIEFAIFWPIC
jgi:hypothetical protein